MSKNVTTRWYIAAWIVGVIALVVFLVSAHVHTTPTSASAFAASPVGAVAWFVYWSCALVMLVMWIGALIRLGQLGRWGWFVFMLVLHLIGLGIIPMVAYAAAGPEGTAVTRPSVT